MNTGKHEQGAVLIVALVFLLLTAMISGTVMQTSILEARMAGNEQLREEAFQQAQAVINAISASSDSFVVAGEVGFKICTNTGNACDSNTLSIASSVTTVPEGAALSYHIERLAPLFAPVPFRKSEEEADSSASYNAALFEVNAKFDGSDAALSQAEIAQGVAVRVAASQ